MVLIPQVEESRMWVLRDQSLLETMLFSRGLPSGLQTRREPI